jgi:Protein of unknown function (DUF1569)
LQADIDRLNNCQVKVLGNWSQGQIYRHLALAFNGSIDGLPFVFPWYVRIVGKMFKKKLLAGPMPAGLKLPARGGPEMIPPPISTEEGLADLRAAIARLESEPKRTRHPVFGEMTREEWNTAHLKHASLHMSFLVPQ